MASIKAFVRNGRVETEDPINLPEGTELTIAITNGSFVSNSADLCSDSPEAIESWLRWYDSLEPVEFSPDERAARDAARHEDKQIELAQWVQRSSQIEDHFR